MNYFFRSLLELPWPLPGLIFYCKSTSNTRVRPACKINPFESDCEVEFSGATQSLAEN